MTRKTAFLLTGIFLLLTAQSCTIQGLPYPTDTPDPNLITPDLEATREMAEAGMFPSTTPEPDAPTIAPQHTCGSGAHTHRDRFPDSQPDP